MRAIYIIYIYSGMGEESSLPPFLPPNIFGMQSKEVISHMNTLKSHAY